VIYALEVLLAIQPEELDKSAIGQPFFALPVPTFCAEGFVFVYAHPAVMVMASWRDVPALLFFAFRAEPSLQF
jgi:hypothetical protein